MRRGYEAWAEYADSAHEEALAAALTIARDRLEAETEIDEIVNTKRRAVRRERGDE